jgi:hypothetical protein
MEVSIMWSNHFRILSDLTTHGNRLATIAWRNGKLYFCASDWISRECEKTFCDDCAVEVGALDEASTQDAQLLESACAQRLYILSGDQTWCSDTGGKHWQPL